MPGGSRRRAPGLDAHALQHLAREAVAELHQREQNVFHVPLRMALLAHHLLAVLEHGLCLLGEPVLSHHLAVTPFLPALAHAMA
ncbi:MAG: hypothetical protein U0360_07590 [Dehalococcoidia bacterium]